MGRRLGIAAELPRKAPKQPVPTRRGHIYWIGNGSNHVLVRQRAMKGLLAGMTEFPSSTWVEGQESFEPPFKASWKKLPGLVEHTFTHFHLELTVWAAQRKSPTLGGRFVDYEELASEALPSLMRKVAAHALKDFKAK